MDLLTRVTKGLKKLVGRRAARPEDARRARTNEMVPTKIGSIRIALRGARNRIFAWRLPHERELLRLEGRREGGQLLHQILADKKLVTKFKKRKHFAAALRFLRNGSTASVDAEGKIGFGA